MGMSSHEEWREIKETDGIYSVSSEGRIKNNKTGDIKKATPIAKGYLKVNLHKDGVRVNRLVHRLVATEFIPNADNKTEVNHKNGIKDDNRVENLEWVTGEENRKHAYDTELIKHKDERYSGYLYSIWIKNHRDNMCDEWQDYLVFYNWCLNNSYESNKYIALKDYTKNYSPNNCYISNNKIHPSRKYKCFNEYLSMDEISEKYGILKGTLVYRLKQGKTMEEAITCKKGKSKDNSLKIRLPERMYEYIFTKASENKISASEYIRQLIDKDVKSSPKIY